MPFAHMLIFEYRGFQWLFSVRPSHGDFIPQSAGKRKELIGRYPEEEALMTALTRDDRSVASDAMR